MTYSGKVDIQQVIDDSRFSGFHWLLIVLGFLVLAIDGFDTAAMGYIAPTLSAEWGIHKQDLGPVLSAALLGPSLGALIAGPVSDRMGRKRVLVFSCLFFGLASLGTAWAQSLNTLTLWRFLTGLGLGAAMPNAITLISEFAPQRCRAMAINTMYCGFPLGAAGGGAGTMTSAQLLSMRWQADSILMILSVPALVAAAATVYKMLYSRSQEPGVA